MTSTTWTGEPPFQGSNGMYEQCGCNMIQVVPAAYADVREGIHLEGELFCDEDRIISMACFVNYFQCFVFVQMP